MQDRLYCSFTRLYNWTVRIPKVLSRVSYVSFGALVQSYMYIVIRFIN